MLVLTSVLLGSACILVVIYTLQTYQLKRRLAGVEQEIREEIDQKTRQDQENDQTLARQLCEGKQTAEAVGRWQSHRAEILVTGRPSDPWNWTADDVRNLQRQECRSRSDEIRRRSVVAMVVSTACVVLVSAVGSLAYYHVLARQSSTPPALSLPGVDDPNTPLSLTNDLPAPPLKDAATDAAAPAVPLDAASAAAP